MMPSLWIMDTKAESGLHEIFIVCHFWVGPDRNAFSIAPKEFGINFLALPNGFASEVVLSITTREPDPAGQAELG